MSEHAIFYTLSLSCVQKAAAKPKAKAAAKKPAAKKPAAKKTAGPKAKKTSAKKPAAKVRIVLERGRRIACTELVYYHSVAEGQGRKARCSSTCGRSTSRSCLGSTSKEGRGETQGRRQAQGKGCREEAGCQEARRKEGRWTQGQEDFCPQGQEGRSKAQGQGASAMRARLITFA